MELRSIADIAVKLAEAEANLVARSIPRTLERIATKLEKDAKEEIAHYQPEIGPYPAWAQLSDETEWRKAHAGYPVDAPLLETGFMRDSIQHEVDGWEAVMGSTDPKMLWHENGTDRIPPRPVIGPALLHNMDMIQSKLGGILVHEITNGQIGDDADREID